VGRLDKSIIALRGGKSAKESSYPSLERLDKASLLSKRWKISKREFIPIISDLWPASQKVLEVV